MVEFLTNEICKLTVLGKAHLLTQGVDILVSVFFKRDQYYKNFGTYVKGLQKVLNFVDNTEYNDPKNGGYVYVLFVDKHVANDPKIRGMIDRCRNCVPVLFGCSDYMQGEYHTDLFGTLVRFFPMFDFENNPCNIVICIDIDLHEEDYVRLKSLMKHKHKGVTAAGDIARYLYVGLNPYIYAGLVCYNRKRTDHKTIINFVRNADKIESTGHYGKRLTTFGYGIDEIFLNEYLLPKIGQINVVIDYQLSYFLFHSKNYLVDPERSDKTSEILSTILGPYDKPNISIDEKFKMIDEITYQVRELTDKNDEISRRFTKVIEHLVDSKKIWLEKKVLMFIHDYLRNVVSSNAVITYDYTEGVTDVKHYEATYDSDYDPKREKKN
ncbi:hypothetical protein YASMINEVIRUS_472 [Yasminevirus sp. GU-2018]|uniref:Uncharacterized protein n=1 Tax=Yasminevirus sp. GU-2018 TaxID=2420051 RepID=A0A5K0U7L7_9VIRU|nr:hypothetical protein YASMINEVIRUS_472 [Yasminevirus sp. GU-2018]